jgi:hypothetical protein
LLTAATQKRLTDLEMFVVLQQEELMNDSIEQIKQINELQKWNKSNNNRQKDEF